ncbi:phosphotransferase [Paenibacillus sp. NPDC058174]|uniref:phosphotransferase n=1 Tax=Paenibacillus sp. NPDC058174 TaxID=3346366 RepID=UPI0036DC1A8B
MSATQYNLQFNKLCTVLQLGEIIGVPEVISGGFLHRMYRIETDLGKYAIKALNPQIMIRPKALQNYINSERIAGIAADNVPALPAKQFNGDSLQKIDDQYFLVFDWIEGRSLKPNEINKTHCEKIGEIVAGIHMTNFSELGIHNNGSSHLQLTDWNQYVQQGQKQNAVWVNLLRENMDQLNEWNFQANHASELLLANMVISHRDMDSKNVMWHQDSPVIIDWEAAGYINPMQDLTDTAIYWSENETGDMDKERFLAVIGGYKKKCETIHANWKVVLENGFLGKLGWLEYSLKRSLWIECSDENEQKMGTEQAVGTIHAIINYADKISELETWLIDET